MRHVLHSYCLLLHILNLEIIINMNENTLTNETAVPAVPALNYAASTAGPVLN